MSSSFLEAAETRARELSQSNSPLERRASSELEAALEIIVIT